MATILGFKLPFFRSKKPSYTYGYVLRLEDGHKNDFVRYNNKEKCCEFIMWEAGEEGHTAPYWHAMGIGWELHFKAYPESEQEAFRLKYD